MISSEEYEIIQRIKSGFSNHATRPRSKFHPDFPLRGMALCTCLQKLTGSWKTGGSGKKYSNYWCKHKECNFYGESIDSTDLHDKFVALLDRVKPKPEFLRLFEAITIKTWKEQQLTAKNEKENYDAKIRALETKREKLIQMRMNNEISKEEFMRMKEGMDNQITGFQISKNEAYTNEMEMETIISSAMDFLADPAQNWKDAGPENKDKIQKLVLPQGITYDKSTGKFGTPILSPIFKLSEDFDPQKSNLVAGPGLAPGSSGYAAVNYSFGLYHLHIHRT